MATNDERRVAGPPGATLPNPNESKAEPEALAADIGHQEEQPHPHDGDLPHWMQTESYGGGEVHARHGKINWWLLVVYFTLFGWAAYYGWVYWGGLGPGLNY